VLVGVNVVGIVTPALARMLVFNTFWYLTDWVLVGENDAGIMMPALRVADGR